jgi:hypothetical protein
VNATLDTDSGRDLPDAVTSLIAAAIRPHPCTCTEPHDSVNLQCLPTLEAVGDQLSAARAHLAQLVDGTHVDARHLVDALSALQLARVELDTAIHDGAVEARDLGVPWSVIGEALGTSKQNAYQRHGKPNGASVLGAT